MLVVGVGAGREYLTPAAERAIASARAFAGGREALELAPPGMPRKVIGRDLEEALEFIEEHLKQGDVAVLTSGDSTLYSILEVLRRRFGEERLEVVPGVSYVQLCFARLKRCWNGVRVLSLHGRGVEVLQGAEDEELALLCDPAHPPQRVARHLLELYGERRCAVCENLGTEDERVFSGWLSEVAEMRFSGRSVMVVWR
ncbi:MAG: precorrin-6y C5,15-methyltransferase (decarboxylating) subunit CbiE [Euryarchaeota archaeon]|nr:precorrin-6y C5,15-methyltransferase (decarboxylating) subunit CbiE [Euryarchaeota archaeon]